MFGVARVSTAYEFYQAVREHCILKEKNWENKPKPPFEATNYILYYFAANAVDAEGKECDYVLDRTTMWDNTEVRGCASAYDFVGMPGSALTLRELPCPCSYCCTGRYEHCTNMCVVGEFRGIAMSAVEYDCPEFLQLPLTGYTIKFMKAFMRKHEVRIPARVTKKNDIIQLMMQTLGDYMLPENNAEA